jgi:hypothetical protein
MLERIAWKFHMKKFTVHSYAISSVLTLEGQFPDVECHHLRLWKTLLNQPSAF